MPLNFIYYNINNNYLQYQFEKQILKNLIFKQYSIVSYKNNDKDVLDLFCKIYYIVLKSN